MAKSARRRKQDRAKAETRRAERARRSARAERDRQRSERYEQLIDPGTRPEDVAAAVAVEMADSPVAGAFAHMRLNAGVPADELAHSARLMLASAAEPPGVGVLAFAAAVAHATGDEDGEHRHTAELLARAEAEGDDVLRIDVISSIAANDHPGEAIGLIEPYLREHPDDERAAEIYGTTMERAHEAAERGERERAALDRFADRSSLIALQDAIGGYLDRTKWGDIVSRRVADTLAEVAEVADEDWPPHEKQLFAALAFEAAVSGASERDPDMSPAEMLDRDRREGLPETALTAFAADPSVPRALASVASAWAAHAECGVWQLADPVPKPGVWCTELVSGTRRYVEFPAAALDGAPPWTVWLGSVGPVDGIWRGSGTGLRLSPAEGDAVAAHAQQAVASIAQLIIGVPGDEMADPQPIPFGRAEPHGVYWDYEEPLNQEYARLASTVTATLITQLAVQVARHRASPPRLRNTDGEPMPLRGAENAWLDERVPALRGRTPRQAAQGDATDVVRLESLLRQFEYQAGLAATQAGKGIDVAWLRAQLGMSAD